MSSIEQARTWALAHQRDAQQESQESGVPHFCDHACLAEAWMSGAAYASEENKITVQQAIAGVTSERRARDRDIEDGED